MAAAFLALVLGACEKKEPAAKGPPPAPVRVATVVQQTIPATTEFVGRAQAYRSVEILARVEGVLEKRHFTEGTNVQTGQLLYTIESAPFEAALRDAQAVLARQDATLVNARSREARLAPLVKENAISQQEYDNAVASMKEAEASVAASAAQVETAKLNLGYTKIYATENGRIGQSLVPEGRLVGRGSPTPLTTIDRIHPIYVSFTASDKDVFEFRRALTSGKIKEGKEQTAQVLLPDGSIYEESGRIDFADIQIGQGTGTMTLRAVLPNPKAELLPGMFLKVDVNSGEIPNTVLVPQKAVIKSPTGHNAWVARPDGSAERRDLLVGKWYKDLWIVDKGLLPGEKVIVDGYQKLQPGSKLVIVPDGAPMPGAAAAPAAAK
ncbi:efflux RND transporter periplasmic adaptor subunit [Uliginosibacterium sp. H1]|uniref:efflux RND transporter periplasmic adaptor subunit n=1 Tax=Uliginosibacterium sp. H1 TaxID=3114757 RepID=UPI002E185BA6|nr:efflux RND transporter periplasmic adaptor subunit [Uliginosibacterium sp. H1]